MKPQAVSDGKKLTSLNRAAFHQGGVITDRLWRNLFNNKKNTGLCVTE